LPPASWRVMMSSGPRKLTLILPLFRVDAFAARLFEGNPAAVCVLGDWLADETLRGIASENNLSETAFVIARGGQYELRWFTPRCEVQLCGHATLATAFVIFNVLEPGRNSVQFSTQSGILAVRSEGNLLALDFPQLAPWTCTEPPPELLNGLGAHAAHAQQIQFLQIKDNYFAVYADEEQIRQARPNLALLEQLHPFGVCITAPGKRSDFVSRYFVPSYGVAEDPVTGSTHCSLAPYWASRLGKRHLHARQLSARGGELWCELVEERVIVKGNAVLYSVGKIVM
jgi:PhzF family phenazine biosynthesis protein